MAGDLGASNSKLDSSGALSSRACLGFGVPYFNTFFLKGTIMKKEFMLVFPWLLKSLVVRESEKT